MFIFLLVLLIITTLSFLVLTIKSNHELKQLDSLPQPGTRKLRDLIIKFLRYVAITINQIIELLIVYDMLAYMNKAKFLVLLVANVILNIELCKDAFKLFKYISDCCNNSNNG